MNAVLKEFVPESWFHPKGIYKVLRRIEPRLPDVQGKLFLTFAVDPKLFSDPATAFDRSRDRLRRVFYALRKGVEWQGKTCRIDAPYCVKVEFHKNGWAHFHVIFLTRRFLPGPLLNEVWGLGRTEVQRISNRHFRYLLKYVCKGEELPEWVLDRKRVRIFQPSHGFYRETEKEEKKAPSKEEKPRATYCIRERLERWSRMALLTEERAGKQRVMVCYLAGKFRRLFDHLVYAVALDGRYLGDGKIQINKRRELYPWIINKEMLTAPSLRAMTMASM